MSASLKRLIELFDNGRLAPCWLIVGPSLQTREFADQLSLYVLSSPQNGHGMSASLVERHVKNGSFGNYMLLQKNEGASEIVIDQLAPLGDFLHKNPLIPGFRIVLVDQVTDFNRFCANSLLKSLEEPPQRTLFLLLCQSLGTLLPTIRSRCQIVLLNEVENSANIVLPHKTEVAELVQLARQGNFTKIQSSCERLVAGDKNVYNVLAITLFDVFYHEALSIKNAESAELWLKLTQFWEDSKKTHLDRQHAFLTMLAGVENPAILNAF